jgi:hypothetical protein
MAADQPAGLSSREWADAPLTLKKVEGGKPYDAIYELRNVAVVNGVPHVQSVWIIQQQLRSIGIDHGL